MLGDETGCRRQHRHLPDLFDRAEHIVGLTAAKESYLQNLYLRTEVRGQVSWKHELHDCATERQMITLRH